MAEVGYPGMDMQAWVGFVAPANVPDGIVARLAAEIRKVMADPEVQAKLIGSGAEPVGYYQQDFTAYMRDESARYKTVIEQAGIRGRVSVRPERTARNARYSEHHAKQNHCRNIAYWT